MATLVRGSLAYMATLVGRSTGVAALPRRSDVRECCARRGIGIRQLGIKNCGLISLRFRHRACSLNSGGVRRLQQIPPPSMVVEDEASPRHGRLASWTASPNITHPTTLIRHGCSGSFSISLPVRPLATAAIEDINESMGKRNFGAM